MGMMENYCGKNCAECTYQAEGSCQGCRVGPGRYPAEDCSLAACVRSKGHDTCATCNLNGHCRTYLNRHLQPEYRDQAKRQRLQWEQMMLKRSQVLGKYLWPIFWLIVPGVIAMLSAVDTLAVRVPIVYWCGRLYTAAWAFANGMLLLKASSEEKGYRTAGLYMLAVAAINLVFAAIPGAMEDQAWRILLWLPTCLLTGYCITFADAAHAEVLTGVDDELSAKWQGIWKSKVLILFGLYASNGVAAFAPEQISWTVAVFLICSVAFVFLQMFYLYKTVQVFRQYALKHALQSAEK